MKKRLASILAAVIFAVSCTASLAACGGGNDGGNELTPAPTLTHSTKPEMPTDSDMQTVATADMSRELTAFRDALLESKNGSYQAYWYSNQDYAQSDNFSEKDEEGNYLMSTDMASCTTNEKAEYAVSYCNIKNDTNPIGAFTSCSYYSNESSVDSTNPNLSYMNGKRLSDYRYTAIQNNSEMYLFQELTHKEWDAEEYKGSEELVRYADNSDKYQKENEDDALLLLEQVVSSYTYYSSFTLGRACLGITKSYQYVLNDNEKSSLYVPDEYMEEIYGIFDVVDFELTVKKSETKFYASTKYTLDFQQYSYEYSDGSGTYSLKSEQDIEYILLIDLGTPASLSSTSTHGKDVANLKLSDVASDYAYLNITSEELTQAVSEGRTITVDIMGNGDQANLTVLDINGRIIPIEDGKVTIDGAAFKSTIDTDSVLSYSFCILFVYSPNGNGVDLNGFQAAISINYSPDN